MKTQRLRSKPQVDEGGLGSCNEVKGRNLEIARLRLEKKQGQANNNVRESMIHCGRRCRVPGFGCRVCGRGE